MGESPYSVYQEARGAVMILFVVLISMIPALQTNLVQRLLIRKDMLLALSAWLLLEPF